jgi:hypothetical protein
MPLSAWAAPAEFSKGISATNPSGNTIEVRPASGMLAISATGPAATASITNVYAKSVSGSTGTFGSIGTGAIDMTGNLTASPLISTSVVGIVRA